MGEKGDKLREAAELADQEEDLQERQKQITEELKSEWLNNQPIANHFDLEKQFAEEHNLALTDARKAIHYELKKYEIEGKDILSIQSKALAKFEKISENLP